MQIRYNFEPLIDRDGTEKVSLILKKRQTTWIECVFSEVGKQTQILALKVTNKFTSYLTTFGHHSLKSKDKTSLVCM